MAKTDRVILVSNDQQFGQVADPNKLENMITHAFDKIDENDTEFINHKKTVDPTSADNTRDKHVSNNDLKGLQDQITTNLNDLTTHKKQVDPTSSDTTRDKHVANNDLKTLQDQITTNDTASVNRDNAHKNASVLDHPDQSVTNSKIKDLAVTSEKIAVGAVGRNQLDPTLFEQTANASKFQEIDAQLADMAKKVSPIVSVLAYGADPNGVNDSTQAFKDTVNYARTTMINNNLKTGIIVVIPAGIYKITDQIVISPFVHIKTQGFVLIQSSVSSKSTFWFTNQTGDPDFQTLMIRQQYNRSPLINGKDGGMLISSTLDKTTSQAIGLEIGSQSDLGSKFALGRYSVCDLAIANFDVGVQMNPFNNYIGTFEHLHLEPNNTNVKFGTTTSVNGSNRGENITFRSCVFAGANNCFDWFVSGMNTNFYGCSFDFNTTLFNLRRGYNNIGVFGGHIEADTVIADATASTDTSSIPTLYLDNPVVLCDTFPLFKGAMSLLCQKVKWQRSINSLGSFLYLCDSNVQAKEIGHVIQGGNDIALSPLSNRIYNSKFQSANLASGDAVMPVNEFTNSQGGGMSAPVVTATIPAGSSYTRALKWSSTTASGSYGTLTTSNGYSVRGGDVIQMGGVVYYDAAAMRGISFQVSFYDKLGNLISSSSAYANKSTAVQGAWNTFFGTNNVVAPAGADTVKLSCTISALATSENAYIGELFLGIS